MKNETNAILIIKATNLKFVAFITCKKNVVKVLKLQHFFDKMTTVKNMDRRI